MKMQPLEDFIYIEDDIKYVFIADLKYIFSQETIDNLATLLNSEKSIKVPFTMYRYEDIKQRIDI